MKFTPKSESECNSFSLLKDGIYDFEIIEAKEKISKSGNDMIELKVKIYEGEKNRGNIFDYLMESLDYKLRHCFAACGLIAQYNTGEASADVLIGRTGKCKVGTQKGNDKYPEDKNIIKDYIPREDYQGKQTTKDATAQAFQSDMSNAPPHTDAENLPF